MNIGMKSLMGFTHTTPLRQITIYRRQKKGKYHLRFYISGPQKVVKKSIVLKNFYC